MAQFRKKFEVYLQHFLDVAMRMAFDMALCLCALFCLWIATFCVERLWPDENLKEVQLLKKVSSISVICSYMFYIIFDLFLYAKRSVREKH